VPGLLVGGALGGVLGFASGDDPQEQWFHMTRGEKAVLGAATFGTVGFAIGFVSSLSRGEGWERVALPPRVSVSGRGDGVFALSYSF
jgi:hypothetical protein